MAFSGPNSRGASVVTSLGRALFTRIFQELPGECWTVWSVRPCSPTAGTTFPRIPFSVTPGWCGGQLKWFLTTPSIVTMGHRNSIPGHVPPGGLKTRTRIPVCQSCHRIIHSSQMVETTHMSIGRRVDTQNVVNPQNKMVSVTKGRKY